MDIKKRMENIVAKMNEASEAYYNGKDEIMSNKEWDAMFDELTALEKETGVILPDSPTQRVGADDETVGEKEPHEFPALSLAKTKSVKDLAKWADKRNVWMSWKLDGCTAVATYDDGKLTKLLTRGDGIIGTNITKKAPAINGIPIGVPFRGHLVVRGEILISYDDFKRINDEIEDEEKKYKNPRNLASGTLNLDDTYEIARRNLVMIAFTPVFIEESVKEYDLDMNRWGERMGFLSSLGFKTVTAMPVTAGSVGQFQRTIDWFTEKVSEFEYPVDGLVICYDDWGYSQTGSITGHHATRAGYAFKWKDETKETVIRDIEWSDSRTGLYNPVAVFDPVELCGTTVSRASLFNLSYVNEKDIKVGDRVTVFKANMIIPCIDENMDAEKFDMFADMMGAFTRYNIPEKCPHCGRSLEPSRTDRAVTVKCTNPGCPAKLIGRLVHFCERDCMNIMGLSEAKLQQLIDLGIVTDIPSLLDLSCQYATTGTITFTNEFGVDERLENQDGWGKESVANLAESINKARSNATFVRFMHAMGIPNFGKGQAKLLAPVIADWILKNPDEEAVYDLMGGLAAMVWSGYDFTRVDGFGEVIAGELTKWVDENLVDVYCRHMPETEVSKTLKYITFTDTYKDYIKDTTDSSIAGLTFVITGDVHIFANRKELQDKIESLGGKATGSVSKKTSYLINNDTESTSGKNKKAKELGIPIISEEEFCKLAGINM